MTLQAALTASGADDQIWIVAGTYTPGPADDSNPATDEREATFTIPTGVKLYGGFAGDEAADFNPATTPLRGGGGVTILSGDLSGDDGTRPIQPAASEDQTAYNTALAAYNATRNDNSNTVVTIAGADVTLDGLTFTAGEGVSGAGLRATGDNTVVTRCTFTNNTASFFGGGAFFGGVVTLTDCTFTGNSATTRSGGGAIFSSIGTTLTDCTFTSNEAISGGGVDFLQTATLTNCTFTNNTATTIGGGATFNAAATLTGCTFTGNMVSEDGGGAHFAFTGATLTGCTFMGNTATVNGGGAYFVKAARLTNGVFAGNTATENGGGLYLVNGGTVINSTFYNNTATNSLGGGIFIATNAASPSNLQNNILIGNMAGSATEGHQVYVGNTDAAHVVNLQHNLIAGGADPMGADQGVRYQTPGSGNITVEDEIDLGTAMVSDVFASLVASEANYLRLAAGSRAANAGNNDYLNNGTPDNPNDDITLDAVGAARIQRGTVDLGAYESDIKGAQDITFTLVGTGAVGTDIELSAMATSGLDVTFELTEEFEVDGITPATDGTVATLASGNILTLVGVGMVTITATQAGNDTYVAAMDVEQTITVAQGTQTISFAGSPAVATVGTDIELVVAGGASGEPVTLAITTGAGLATLSGTTLSPTGAGTVIITAMQVGNANYEAATAMTHEITVGQGTQTIMFTSPAVGTINTDIDLEATASSGLDVTFMITGGTGTATLSGGTTLTLTGAGTVIITATQAGNANYAATTQEQTITVSAIPLMPQTIDFTSSETGVVGTNIDLVATAGPGLAVTFEITTETLPDGSAATTGKVATLADNGTTLTLTGVGTVVITATQAGGTGTDGVTYAPATQMQTITVSQGTQTIMFTSPTAGTVGTPIELMVTVSSGLAVTFAVTNQSPTSGSGEVATLASNGTTLSLIGAGTVTITATQAGGVGSDGVTYAAATPVMQTITVSKQAQTIMFTLAMTTGTVDDKIDLTATATSSLPVTFTSSDEAVVAIGTGADAGMLVLKTAGTAIITASQSGDDTYAAAADVTQTIMVEAAMVLGIEEVADGFVLYPNPTSGKLHFSEQVAEFRLYGIEGRLLETRKNVRSADLSARPAGLYFVEVVRGERSFRWRVVRE